MGLPFLGLSQLLGSGPAQGLRHFAPRAKRMIHIFFNGGSSHIDTFDPKPALTKYHGQRLPTPTLVTERPTGVAFASPFSFKQYGQSGLPISSIFSEVGEVIDEVCIIRSMQAEVPNHEPSLMLLNTGDGTLVRPSLGSWLTYGLGSENENLPSFVALCPGGGKLPIKGADNWRAAFLPGKYQGTAIDTMQQTPQQMLENIEHAHLPSQSQRRQIDLLQRLNRQHQSDRTDDPRLEARIESFEQAYRMQTAALDAFDLRHEPQYVLDEYGNSPQSRQILLSRRLVERGVRFVQCWHGAGQPWDNHSDLESAHKKNAGQVSRAIAALIRDLRRRGLLDETLVMWGGEFGRTPTTEGTNGRDHNHHGFSLCLAGGGIRGGMTYGSTDEFGWAATESPVQVHDLHATILHLMGLDHERLTYRFAGRDFRLTDVSGHVIREIIA
jgi:hypothetical protein